MNIKRTVFKTITYVLLIICTNSSQLLGQERHPSFKKADMLEPSFLTADRLFTNKETISNYIAFLDNAVLQELEKVYGLEFQKKGIYKRKRTHENQDRALVVIGLVNHYIDQLGEEAELEQNQRKYPLAEMRAEGKRRFKASVDFIANTLTFESEEFQKLYDAEKYDDAFKYLFRPESCEAGQGIRIVNMLSNVTSSELISQISVHLKNFTLPIVTEETAPANTNATPAAPSSTFKQRLTHSVSAVKARALLLWVATKAAAQAFGSTLSQSGMPNGGLHPARTNDTSGTGKINDR